MESNELVELYWQRDEAALEETQKKYKGYCLSIAMNILGDRSDAEECFNDTLMALWNSIPPKRPVDLRAYIAKIAHNKCIDKARKNSAAKRGPDTVPLEELENCFGSIDIEDEEELSEIQGKLNAFLNTCTAEERALFVRRYFFFESVSVIAQKYSMKANTVSKELSRTREKLKKYLDKEGCTI